jgi:hypothetical protein
MQGAAGIILLQVSVPEALSHFPTGCTSLMKASQIHPLSHRPGESK